MEYRELSLEEAQRIGEINAEQIIKRAWREVDGIRQLVVINWLERQLPNGLEWHIAQLKDSLVNGGKAYGCFEEERLIGYAVIDGKLFGKGARYILLDQLFISLEYRGQGIGSALFRLCCEAAEYMKADKIYMCRVSRRNRCILFFNRV